MGAHFFIDYGKWTLGAVLKTFQKPLSSQEEVYYIQLMKEGGIDEAARAREILIERNLRLVAHIAKKYQNTEEELDDLISIGTIGLIKAINSYDAKKGSRIGTYAARCIDNAILSQMRLWFRINPPSAEKHQNGVLWHRFPKMSTSFVPLRTAM